MEGLRHPSKDIVGRVNDYLAGRCVVLGVTGSVSLYKSIDLARWLMRRGARVVPVMTRPASSLVAPQLFHWATGERPIVELGGDVEHIALARSCDSMVVAPATLSTMAKIASGVVDNAVALTAVSMVGAGRPVVVVPAMHGNMMESSVYARIASRLAGDGLILIPPKVEEGVAKYPDVWLVGRVVAAVTARGRDLDGRRVLVTAGATREWLDPARFISNPSSGRMGIELAVEAWARGAHVDLVYGHVAYPLPHMVGLYHAETTEEMAARVAELSSTGYDILVAAAAPADFRPKKYSSEKIRSGSKLHVEFEPTPKVIESAMGRAKALVVFAAEPVGDPEALEKAALDKLEKYYADIVVANNIAAEGAGFSADDLEAVVGWREGERVLFKRFGRINKEVLSRVVYDLSLRVLGGKDA